MADAESPALSTRENDHDQWPMRCTSGCSRSGRGLPATRQLPPHRLLPQPLAGTDALP